MESIEKNQENVIVRLYYPYDADLIALMEMPGFSIAYVTKQALIYCADGKRLTISTPPARTYRAGRTEHVAYTYHFILDKDKDEKALKFLHTIKAGLRCSFLKALVKASVDFAHLEYFIDEADENAERSFEFMNRVKSSKNRYVCPLQKKAVVGVTGKLSEFDSSIEECPEECVEVPVKDGMVLNDEMDFTSEEKDEILGVAKQDKPFVYKTANERRREMKEKRHQSAFEILKNR